ncbi:MAG: phage major capsid protein [Candidatus Thorarchaeota archaeon]|jgi:hypothetical protein
MNHILNRHRDLARHLDCYRREGREEDFWEGLQEGLETGQLDASKDFTIRCLFEAFVPDGNEILQSWSPKSGGGSSGVMLTEAGEAVRTTDFSDITGQILFTRMLEAYADPVFLAPAVTTTVPTEFNGEKIPGIARIGDQAESIGEADPYPLAGVSQDFIETPETTKRGFIVPVTKEAIFFDRTGMLMQRATEVGYWLGVNKEKRVLDVVLGVENNYNRKKTGPVNTYGDAAGEKDWDNLATGNALYDWTNIEVAELLFDGMTDPNTGEPIMINYTTLIVPSALKHTSRRVVNATEIRHGDTGATPENTRTISSNPLKPYTILSNQYVKDRSGSTTSWWVGDPRSAFWYMENWPITSVTAPPNNYDEFHRDIVHQEKVSERGVCAVVEPRKMVQNDA